MTSAPARTYAWWTSATRSGCVRFSSSNDRFRKMPFAYSIVPIAPSQTSTRWSSSSRKGVRHTRSAAGLQRLRWYSNVCRLDDQIGTTRDTRSRPTDRTPCRSISVNRWWCPNRCSRGFIAARTSLIGVLPASLPRPRTDAKRPRRFVRQEDVDALASPCRPRLLRGRNAAAGRRARSPSRVPFFGCGRSAAGVSYHRRRERAAETGDAERPQSSAALPLGM